MKYRIRILSIFSPSLSWISWQSFPTLLLDQHLSSYPKIQVLYTNIIVFFTPLREKRDKVPMQCAK